MATYKEALVVSFIAGADLSNNRYAPVALDANGNVVLAGANSQSHHSGIERSLRQFCRQQQFHSQSHHSGIESYPRQYSKSQNQTSQSHHSGTGEGDEWERGRNGDRERRRWGEREKRRRRW
ncbi:MAG: hypothetical protein ACK4I8_09790 [Armatimonadota bacterium]